MKIALFAGDGIGPEIMEQARRVLDALNLPGLVVWEGDVGGAAYRRHGHPLPEETLEMVPPVPPQLLLDPRTRRIYQDRALWKPVVPEHAAWAKVSTLACRTRGFCWLSGEEHQCFIGHDPACPNRRGQAGSS